MTLYRMSGERRLDNAVLVVGLEGWIDAGLAASTAIGSLLPRTELVATFECEDLIDQRARRPVVELQDGRTAGLTWPELQLRAGIDRAGNTYALLIGPEPDYHWRRFADAVTELSVGLGIRMAVGLGAFPAPAPHTRPVRIAATSPDAELVSRVGTIVGTLNVPAGVEALLELTLHAAGIPAMGLWARVPHYVSTMPFPGASAALIDTLAALSGLDVDSAPLHTAGDVARQQVEELIGKSAEHRRMVRQLEERLDAAEGNPLDLGVIPSGDQIAAELERYLRDEG